MIGRRKEKQAQEKPTAAEKVASPSAASLDEASPAIKRETTRPTARWQTNWRQGNTRDRFAHSSRGIKPVGKADTTRVPHTARRIRGDGGEALATDYLTAQGMHIVARNFFTPSGEIDIVATDGSRIRFIEVKLRVAGRMVDRFGRPAAAVTAGKRRHLISCAREYLRAHPTTLCPCFDVLEILLPEQEGTSPPQLHLIRNAFGVNYT